MKLADLHSLEAHRARKQARTTAQAEAERFLRIEEEAYARRMEWLLSHGQEEVEYEPMGGNPDPLDLCPEPDLRDELSPLNEWNRFEEGQ